MNKKLRILNSFIGIIGVVPLIILIFFIINNNMGHLIFAPNVVGKTKINLTIFLIVVSLFLVVGMIDSCSNIFKKIYDLEIIKIINSIFNSGFLVLLVVAFFPSSFIVYTIKDISSNVFIAIGLIVLYFLIVVMVCLNFFVSIVCRIKKEETSIFMNFGLFLVYFFMINSFLTTWLYL